MSLNKEPNTYLAFKMAYESLEVAKLILNLCSLFYMPISPTIYISVHSEGLL